MRVSAAPSGETARTGYVPASVATFPQRECFLAAMRHAGFDEVAWEEISLGIVCLYRGRKAPQTASPAAGGQPERSSS